MATLIDDALFGGVIVAARLAVGTAGLLAASGVFIALSVAMAAATAWALLTEPLSLSPKDPRTHRYNNGVSADTSSRTPIYQSRPPPPQ